MSRLIDLTDKRFGHLLVVHRSPNNTQGKTVWKCLCDCGKYKNINGDCLRRGHTKTCGCSYGRNLTQDRIHRRRKRQERCDNLNRQGLCVVCGKRDAVAGDKLRLCDICWIKSTLQRSTGSRKNWKTLRDALVSQKHCPYSGVELIIGKNASIDHKIPVSRGGTHDVNNLQWIDLHINYMKRDMTDDEFRAVIRLLYCNLENSNG